MDPLHLHANVQYTLKLEPRCTTGPALDQMEQDFSPERRNDWWAQCTPLLFDEVNVTTDHESDDFGAEQEDNTCLLGMGFNTTTNIFCICDG